MALSDDQFIAYGYEKNKRICEMDGQPDAGSSPDSRLEWMPGS